MVRKMAVRRRPPSSIKHTYMASTVNAAITEVVTCVSGTTLACSSTCNRLATKKTGTFSSPGTIGYSEITWPPTRTNHQGTLFDGSSGATR